MLRTDESKSIVSPMLYWRSDTRPPEDIFRTGFDSYEKSSQDEWWKDCIRDKKIGNPDALSHKCICMSTSFSSACLFPISQYAESISYLYAIALPVSCKINLDQQLSGENAVPSDATQTVIDFHTHQVECAQRDVEKAYKQGNKNNKNLTESLASKLYAYEAFSYKVDSGSIICAIKIHRENLEFAKIRSSVLVSVSLERNYRVDDSTILNSRFIPCKDVEYKVDGCATTINFDYNEIKLQALNFLDKIERNKAYRTPNIYHGLGGKVLASNVDIENMPKYTAFSRMTLFFFDDEEKLPADPACDKQTCEDEVAKNNKPANS